MRTKIGVIILLFTGIVTFAQEPVAVVGEDFGWYKLGNISVSFKKESETIVVANNEEEFKSIRLSAKDVPIAIEHVQVFFEGGKVQQAEVNQSLNTGEHTEPINLYVENKKLSKVVFVYARINKDANSERAEVELYGSKEFGKTATMNMSMPESGRSDETVRTSADSSVEKDVGPDGEIKDEKIESKAGPNGESIYLDANKNYYLINEKGEKRFISVFDLIDKE